MGSHSTVQILGHIVRDPNVKHLANNTALAKFTVAVNRRWTDHNGNRQEEASFVDCEAWAGVAETIGQYLRKGDPIYLVGRLKQDTWEQDGRSHSKLKVVCEHFQFVGGREERQDQLTLAEVVEEDMPF